MGCKFDIKLCLNDEDATPHIFNGSVSFGHDPNQYGNGYNMFVEAETEPFGRQDYDIRYDTDFVPKNMIGYIANFFANRFNSKEYGWRLVGIDIHEVE